jgi:glutathione S-transferase
MSATGGVPIVTLYGRHGCHLCDEARLQLLDLRRAGAAFQLREVDIETDDELHRTMLELIPVVEVEGERVSELLFEPDAVLRRIDTLSR